MLLQSGNAFLTAAPRLTCAVTTRSTKAGGTPRRSRGMDGLPKRSICRKPAKLDPRHRRARPAPSANRTTTRRRGRWYDFQLHRVGVPQGSRARQGGFDGAADAGGARMRLLEGHGARDLQVELDQAAAAASPGPEVVQADHLRREGGDDRLDPAQLGI